jgi:hypothetical protein
MSRFSPEFLKEASETYGFSEEDLEKGYLKGVVAWDKATAPSGSTPEQLGMAVVDQMILIRKESLAEDKEWPPDPNTPETFKARTKNKKVKKRQKDSEDDTKYTNQQPSDVYASARMGGISGAFSSNMAEAFENNMKEPPENRYLPSLKEWGMNEEVQALYVKKYADKAFDKLMEATNTLQNALRVHKVVPVTFPTEPLFEGGKKRQAYSLMNWHTERLNNPTNPPELNEWHLNKVQEYKNKVTRKNALDV